MRRPPAEREVAAAVGLADDDRDLRHPGPCEPRDDPLVAAEDAAALGVGADHQARHVLEEDEREVERVAEVDERGLLRERGHVHARRHAASAGSRRRRPPRPRRGRSEQSTLAPYRSRPGSDGAGVENRLEHLAHVVAAARVARHEREQLLGLARREGRPAPAAPDGRPSPAGRRAPAGRPRARLPRRRRRGARCRSARWTPSARRARRPSAPRRSRPRSREGRRGRSRRPSSSRRSAPSRHAARSRRSSRRRRRSGAAPRAALRVPGRTCGSRTAAPEKRQPMTSGMRPPSLSLRQISGRPRLPGPECDPVLLAHVDLAGRAGEDGRVDGEHAHLAAVDAREAGHDRVAGAGSSRRCSGSASSPSSKQGALVDERVEALAGGQAPGGVVPLDALRAAHRERGRTPALQVGEPLRHARRPRDPSCAVAHRPSNCGRATVGERGDALARSRRCPAASRPRRRRAGSAPSPRR